jgi:hypothetical protein
MFWEIVDLGEGDGILTNAIKRILFIVGQSKA